MKFLFYHNSWLNPYSNNDSPIKLKTSKKWHFWPFFRDLENFIKINLKKIKISKKKNYLKIKFSTGPGEVHQNGKRVKNWHFLGLFRAIIMLLPGNNTNPSHLGWKDPKNTNFEAFFYPFLPFWWTSPTDFFCPK